MCGLKSLVKVLQLAMIGSGSNIFGLWRFDTDFALLVFVFFIVDLLYILRSRLTVDFRARLMMDSSGPAARAHDAARSLGALVYLPSLVLCFLPR